MKEETPLRYSKAKLSNIPALAEAWCTWMDEGSVLGDGYLHLRENHLMILKICRLTTQGLYEPLEARAYIAWRASLVVGSLSCLSSACVSIVRHWPSQAAGTDKSKAAWRVRRILASEYYENTTLIKLL